MELYWCTLWHKWTCFWEGNSLECVCQSASHTDCRSDSLGTVRNMSWVGGMVHCFWANLQEWDARFDLLLCPWSPLDKWSWCLGVGLEADHTPYRGWQHLECTFADRNCAGRWYSWLDLAWWRWVCIDAAHSGNRCIHNWCCHGGWSCVLSACRQCGWSPKPIVGNYRDHVCCVVSGWVVSRQNCWALLAMPEQHFVIWTWSETLV